MMMRAAALALMLPAAPAFAGHPPHPVCDDADGSRIHISDVLIEFGGQDVIDFSRVPADPRAGPGPRYAAFCAQGRAVRYEDTGPDSVSIYSLYSVVQEAGDSLRSHGPADMVRMLRRASYKAENVALDRRSCVCNGESWRSSW